MSHEPNSGSIGNFTLPAADALLDLGFRTESEQTEAFSGFTQKAGDYIGRYRLVAPLGEGGFGLVWRAMQDEPVRRELALKVIKPGMDSRTIIARFEAERQTLAMMDHPNIAGVLDAGTSDDGRPYFVMELVRGEPITTYCDRHKLGIDERLALFIPVCRAVQHAHQKAILHRDLKPSNILVATVDGAPVPKVIDFGIAKALLGNNGSEAAEMAHTQAGVAIGTPRYMSPEQAGSSPDVDTRSDIYSLGVVLCELLTGQSPHPGEPPNVGDALQWIRDCDPVRPSTLAESATDVAGGAAERRGMDARDLARRLRGDLDWITLKALEKDRTLRYDTATAFARDLERHLAAEPVSAAALTWRYNFGKFARRRRGELIAASLVGAALITGTVVSLWLASEAKQSRNEAYRRYAQARDAVDKYLVRVTGNPKLNQSNFVDLQRELLEAAMPFYEDLSRYQGNDPKLLADRAWASGNLADIFLHVGELEKAEAAYHRTIDDLAKLVSLQPNDPDRRFTLGQRQDGLAQLLHRRGKLRESLLAHKEAVKTIEALRASLGGDQNYEYTLAMVYNNQAITLDALGDEKAAVESRNVARAIGDKLVNDNPDIADNWLILATAAGNEADQLHRRKRYDEEVSVRRRAVECYEAAADTRADSRVYREYLAINRRALGEALGLDNRLIEAEPVLRQAVREMSALASEFPSFTSYPGGLLESQNALARNLRLQNRIAESDAVLEQARVGRELMLPTSSGDSGSAGERPLGRKSPGDVAKGAVGATEVASGREPAPPQDSDMSRQAAAELSAGNYHRAIEIARELPKLEPADWQGWVDAAEVIAAALPSMQVDANLDVTARQKLVTECAAEAVDYLKRAVANGYTGTAHFDTLACATSLRATPSYQELISAPVAPPVNSPTSFYFDYPHADPGPRYWVRDGLTWTETQPSGTKNIYRVIGPIVLKGVRGSKLIQTRSRQTAFVPDLNAVKEPSLWLRGSDGKWGRFVGLKDVK